MGCLVCGSSATVKSHIFPRSLMLDVRGNDPHLHQIQLDREGSKFLQNGPWDDDILCAEHEELTQAADDYAAKFCREAVAKVSQSSGRGTIPNPKPDLLAKFAYQTVWRFSGSRLGRGVNTLGPFSDIMRDCSFGSRTPELPVLLARNHLTMPDGSESSLVVAPFPSRLGQWRCWLFSVGGVQFYTKCDRRPFPNGWQDYFANRNNPAVILKLEKMQAHLVPILQPVMRQMAKR